MARAATARAACQSNPGDWGTAEGAAASSRHPPPPSRKSALPRAGIEKLPKPIAAQQRAAGRHSRREEARRREMLAKVKEELIRRSLYEEHPENVGGCLWDS